jgi:hypothetical protein
MKAIKAQINTSNIITSVIGAIVLFLVVAELYPEFSTAGDSLNASGIPLGGFFVSGGILALLLAVGIFYGLYRAFMTKEV